LNSSSVSNDLVKIRAAHGRPPIDRLAGDPCAMNSHDVDGRAFTRPKKVSVSR